MKSLPIFYCLLSLCVVIFSCKKENAAHTETFSVYFEGKKLNTLNVNILEEVKINYSKTAYTFTSNIEDEDKVFLFNQIKSRYKGDLTDVTLPEIIVIYSKKSAANIFLNDIVGVSIFHYKNDEFFHSLFQIDNGIAQRNLKLEATSTYLRLNSFFIIRDNFFKDIPSVYFALLSPFSNGIHNTQNNFKYDNLYSLLTQNYSMAAPEGCWICGGGNESFCTQTGPFGEWWCEGTLPPDCPQEQINEIGYEMNVSQDSLLDNERGYDFRDNFMKFYEVKGVEYGQHYYNIGVIIKEYNTITHSNFYDHLNFAYKVYQVVDILQYGQDSDVPVSSIFYGDALNMINFYRGFSNESSFQNSLDAIEADLFNFVGKTRAEILLELE
jgi:hypothetical protein